MKLLDSLVANLAYGVFDQALEGLFYDSTRLNNTTLGTSAYVANMPIPSLSRPQDGRTSSVMKWEFMRDHARKSPVLRADFAGYGEKRDGAGRAKDVTMLRVWKFDVDKIKVQLQEFLDMAMPYFQEKTEGRKIFAVMVGMIFLNSGVRVAYSFVMKEFWSALSAKNVALFHSVIAKFSGALVVAVPVNVFFTFVREQLANKWREWMSSRMIQLYSSNRVYYLLERGREIDNPDQRIAEDVNTFTSFALSFFITIVRSSIDLAAFSAILYSIQPRLFGTIIVYAAFGSFTTISLGRKLIRLNYDQRQKEANFRYALVRIREYAESIAFYAGENVEGKKISDGLLQVVDNQRDLKVAERNLNFFTSAYRYLIQVLPVYVVAAQYFKGSIPLGVVSQSAEAFNHILSDMSLIVNQFEQLSAFSAGIDRLSSFARKMRAVDAGRSNTSALMKLHCLPARHLSQPQASRNSDGASHVHLIKATRRDGTASNSSALTLKHLSLSTPDRKRLLIDDLSLSLQYGKNLLIDGTSGAGKSSLLRAIAGLWTAGSGTIERPSDEDVCFLPQRPYCSIGSLKEQLLYPNNEDVSPDDYLQHHGLSRSHIIDQSFSNQDLLDILKAIDLEELPFRAGDGDPIKGLTSVNWDWSNTLSLGEQQRLAFGRLLVNRPRLAILDEATSALDVRTEARMYSLLQDIAREKGMGLTYISVGHRPSLLRYHDVRLQLNGGEKSSVGSIISAIEGDVNGSTLIE